MAQFMNGMLNATNEASESVVQLPTEGAVGARRPVVTPIMTKDLPEFPGKEVIIMTVVYPPGGSVPIHRHDAHGFMYVLEGSVVMQLKGEMSVTLKPGQSFYEGPGDIHIVGRNASSTEPAVFV